MRTQKDDSLPPSLWAPPTNNLGHLPPPSPENHHRGHLPPPVPDPVTGRYSEGAGGQLATSVFGYGYYAPALGGAFWNSAIRPSVCPMAQLPRL